MKTYLAPQMLVCELERVCVIATSGGPTMTGGPGNSDDGDLDGGDWGVLCLIRQKAAPIGAPSVRKLL